MRYKNLLVLLVGVFVAVFAVNAVSAFGDITKVEISGIDVIGTGAVNLANFAGDRVPILVRFDATDNAEDVRIEAWITGDRRSGVESRVFDVLVNRTYVKVIELEIPSDFGERLEEGRELRIVVEGRVGGNYNTADEKTIDLTVQRESHLLDIVNVDMQSEVKSGESLVLDVVLENTGRQLARKVFLRIAIPELGLETTTYYGDLGPYDQSDPDRDDTVERRTFLRIPFNVAPGLYTVRIEAFNDDSFTALERRISVDGASEETLLVSASQGKTFSVGGQGEFKLTLVNRGNVVRVYEVSADGPAGLNLEVSDPAVVVPAGSSRTVSIFAEAGEKDDYTFVVRVTSEGNPIGEKTFVANVVEGDGKGDGVGVTDATVLLTVILAIIFIVLLVVLIVLLTRKPETKEEFGESYY